LYWWYNFLYLDATFSGWILNKTSYSAVIDSESVLWQASYLWVNKWSGYYHPSFVSLLLFFGLITSFHLNFQKYITKFDLFLCTALCFLVIMLMQSRIGFVGISLITIVSVLHGLSKKNKWLALALGFCVLVASLVFYTQSTKVSDFSNDGVRKAYNEVAINYIKDNFWWGSGFRQQREGLEQQAEAIKEALPPFVYPHKEHPIYYVHNQFLGDMVQFGIWGLIALLLMLSVIAYYAIKNRSYLLQMMLVATILFMMVEEPFYVMRSFMCFAVFLAFFVAITESEKKQHTSKIE
jgi:hypothetical protein